MRIDRCEVWIAAGHQDHHLQYITYICKCTVFRQVHSIDIETKETVVNLLGRKEFGFIAIPLQYLLRQT